MAYNGTKNVFNLAYEVLAWKVHRALIKAKLEPYLGFLHSNQRGKVSLACDSQELYRYVIDDFLIKYCQKIRKKDFITVTEEISKNKLIWRAYLNDLASDELADGINQLFERQFEVPRIRSDQRQALTTLINEETQLFAKYLRGERKTLVPRMPII
jgi:CRISPR/Cas system-associated endonuclease Cas1